MVLGSVGMYDGGWLVLGNVGLCAILLDSVVSMVMVIVDRVVGVGCWRSLMSLARVKIGDETRVRPTGDSSKGAWSLR